MDPILSPIVPFLRRVSPMPPPEEGALEETSTEEASQLVQPHFATEPVLAEETPSPPSLQIPTFSSQRELRGIATPQETVMVPRFSETLGERALEEIHSEEAPQLPQPHFATEPVLAEEIAPSPSFQIPTFSSQRELREASTSERTMVLPSFSEAPEEVEKIGEIATLILPRKLLPTIFPREDRVPAANLQLPNFSAAENPTEHLLPQATLALPSWSAAPDFQEEKVPAPTLRLPSFISSTEVEATERSIQKATITLPSFSKPTFPEPKTALERLPFEGAKTIKRPHGLVEHHPTVKRFDLLIQRKTYQEVLKAAIQYGTLEDYRMLKKHSLLKERYFDHLCERLLEEAPSLLPRSEHFTVSLTNDQTQLDLLVTCCHDLIEADPTALVKALSIDTDHGIFRKRTLEFKDLLYCFLREILLQEQQEAQKFGAIEKKLSPLEEALSLLAAHIQQESHEIQMEMVHQVRGFTLAPFEDRTPTAASAITLDRPGVEKDQQKLEAALKAIQGGKPTEKDVQQFIDQVLLLPDTSEETLTQKAGYLLELGKFYTALPTLLAWERALTWIDRAFTWLGSHVEKDHPTLLALYEQRGVIWLKMAEDLRKTSTDEVSRKRLDSAYRDFHRALPLPASQENFVWRYQKAKENKSTPEARLELKKVLKADPDYAEARYEDFLRGFDQDQLDEKKLLHPQFDGLREVAPSQVLDHFKELLIQKSHHRQPNPTLFKVELSTGSGVIKWTNHGIYLNSSRIDFLKELFYGGIQKVSVLSHEQKNYFGAPLSKERFGQLFQSLAADGSRLKAIERGLKAFHTFEITAFYKRSMKNDEKEALGPNAILSTLDQKLALHMIDLEAAAMEGYARLGKHHRSNWAKKCHGHALLHASRAIRGCERLMAMFHERTLELISQKTMLKALSAIQECDRLMARFHAFTLELRSKKTTLMIKRAMAYREMGLHHAEATDLEEAIAYGRSHHPHFLNAPLHYALGLAYQKLELWEEAKGQFSLILNVKKKVAKEAKYRLEEIEKEQKKKRPRKKVKPKKRKSWLKRLPPSSIFNTKTSKRSACRSYEMSIRQIPTSTLIDEPTCGQPLPNKSSKQQPSKPFVKQFFLGFYLQTK